jgi:hypothetical protein
MNPMAFDPFTLRQMIREHGIALTLRKRAAGAYSDATGTVTTTNTDSALLGYFYDYTPDMIDGSSILRGDRRVVLDNKLTNGSATPEPDATDQIIGLGDTVNIVKVMEIKSGSGTMCYLLQVRE